MFPFKINIMASRIETVKKACKPLIKLPDVAAIWTVSKKGKTMKGMVLLDDTRKFLPLSVMKSANDAISSVKKKAAKARVKLGFLPAKRITVWWDMVRLGDPVAVRLLSGAEIIYDKTGVCGMMANLVREGDVYSIEAKPVVLISRSKDELKKAREILLEKAPLEVLATMKETAHATLMYYGIKPPTEDDIANALREAFVSKGLLKEDVIRVFETIAARIRKGSRLTGEELEQFTHKARRFMFEMEELILRVEKEKNHPELEEAYSSTIALCSKAIRQESEKVPKSEEEKIMLFKKLFVDKGRVSSVHFRTLKELYVFSKAKKKVRDKISNERYLDRVHVNGLRLAATELTQK